MKEDFLHYVWHFKKFKFTQLHTFQNHELSILHTGYYLKQSGPDFFNAQLLIDNQKWAGNVEIHLKSSDWYVHHHETDSNYDNVILHVVWEHDVEIYRKDATVIPVLELKHYVDQSVVENYNQLVAAKSWINCENQLKNLPEFTLSHWIERLYIERLEQKTSELELVLLKTTTNWEHVFYISLARSFGLNTNGVSFQELLLSIPFSVLKKEQHDLLALEALFFGRVGLLENHFEDNYYQDLKSKWHFLVHKYQLQSTSIVAPEFFKHRPDNFPTIRLAQLAQLLHRESNLLQRCLDTTSLSAFYTLFNIQVSDYWKTHYTFDHKSTFKSKSLSKGFVDLLLLNCVLPIKFSYSKSKGIQNIEELLALALEIKSEKNSIIEKFQQFGLASSSSLHSQALLHLKSKYCNQNKCLQCEIGKNLINFTSPK
ncbi:DUF2851 family protein [Flavobacterium orientale]|uniref:DUF2851 domain-containing protein n=1 Tax=Flavobacterium orientale TaxID=1756020 RepID=A0A917D8E1_9FLAO|nr:DUF2851 family protein [Flavobacterium orientale]GGD14599.1 hypothetical protein GCM10011343_02060 [Flavobacterium orientale]